jgi:hypothetical protein
MGLWSATEGKRNLNTVLQEALDQINGHLIRKKEIMLNDTRFTNFIYPGMEYEAENDTMHIYGRIFLVGTTLYQTLTAAPLGNPYADNTRFLDSFKLIARTSN